MANSVGTPTIRRSVQQFQGAFREMWTVRATITDQDAITATDAATFAVSVPGVQLGDMVIAHSLSVSPFDGADLAMTECYIAAAGALRLQVQADAGAFAADTLNGAELRVLIGRPSF